MDNIDRPRESVTSRIYLDKGTSSSRDYTSSSYTSSYTYLNGKSYSSSSTSSTSFSSTFSSKKKYHGFKNLGNTCYINAVLHALTKLYPFVTDVKNDLLIGAPARSPDGILSSLLEVIANVEENATKKDAFSSISPANLKEALAKHKSFIGYGQHDAHELLVTLISKLEEEVAALYKLDQIVPSNTVQEECPVNRNFICRVEHTFKCSKCGFVSTKVEDFHHFSLEVPTERYTQHKMSVTYRNSDNSRPQSLRKLIQEFLQVLSPLLLLTIIRLPKCPNNARSATIAATTQ
jgi:uncharacterized UBP type Zn finger protein